MHALGRPRLTGEQRLVREVGLALVTAGVVVLLFVVYELVGTNLAEEHSQARLARAFDAAVAGARPAGTPVTTSPRAKQGPAYRRRQPVTSTTRPPAAPLHHRRTSGNGGPPAGRNGGAATVPLPVPPPGGALDHLVIPAIGVDRYVVEGVGEADLQMGPGHYPGTALPGQAGNVGIAGHRTTFGAPFFRLNELVPGDAIYLTDISGTTWVYDVVHQWVVPPSDTAVLDPTRRPELTLTTCNPRFEATSRLVVRALLVESLPRGARLRGRLPVAASHPAAAPRTAVPRTATPRKAALRKAALGKAALGKAALGKPRSTLLTTTTPLATTVTNTARPGTTATPPVSPGEGKAPGGAGADSPTVGPLSASGNREGLWVAALGWGALAVLGWIATRVLASRRYRFAKIGVLVCGALVCLVPLWFAFANVVDLLPANL